jgi:hypothetical protein
VCACVCVCVCIYECPLCHQPDSCTHIASECPNHNNHIISRYNAACELVHAAIRKAAKGGGSMHNAPDIFSLRQTNTATQSQTTAEMYLSLQITPEETRNENPRKLYPLEDWLEEHPSSTTTQFRRHTHASRDPRCIDGSLSAANGDDECTTSSHHRVPN